MARVAGKVTQKQVAREAGVSEAAVSAVLSGQTVQRRIAPKTVEQIRSVMQRLNYRPVRAAGEKKINHLIGVILKGRVRYALANPYYGDIFQGVEEVLDAEGFSAAIGKADDNFQTGRVAHLLSQRKVDGLLLLGELPAEDLKWLSSFGTDMVSVNFVAGPHIPSVAFDFRGSRVMAMEYLASRGHKRVAFLSSSLGTQNSREEEVGYVQGLRPPNEPIVIRAKGGDIDHGQDAIAEYLKSLRSNQKLPFTCLLGESDTLAAGAILAFAEHGLKVPTDVSVMGGQDLHLPSNYRMAITTTSLDKLEMGRQGAKYLLGKVRGGNSAAVRIVMPSGIIERETVTSI